MDIGRAIIESTMATIGSDTKALNEQAPEIAVGKTTIKTEEFGTPVADGDTIRIPVVVASVYETFSEENPKMPDQAFLDRNRDALLQRLVVKMNSGSGRPIDYYDAPKVYFEGNTFKMEWLEGNVLRLKATVIVDLRGILDSVRGLRWRMSDAVRDLVGNGSNGMKKSVR